MAMGGSAPLKNNVRARTNNATSLVFRRAGNMRLGAQSFEARTPEVARATVHWRAHLICQVTEPGHGAPLSVFS